MSPEIVTENVHITKGNKIVTWKQFLCSHHWHRVCDSLRKVKSPYKPECHRVSGERAQYIIGYGRSKAIMVKAMDECCKCKKRRIVSWKCPAYPQQDYDIIMSLPDIDDEPLSI